MKTMNKIIKEVIDCLENCDITVKKDNGDEITFCIAYNSDFVKNCYAVNFCENGTTKEAFVSSKEIKKFIILYFDEDIEIYDHDTASLFKVTGKEWIDAIKEEIEFEKN